MWVPSEVSGTPADTSRSRVGHNAILNFFGLAVPLALAFFIMPIAARNLGPARFGLLGLAWAVTEYLTLFDLGLGRALVTFVADALHRNSPQLSEIVSLSMIAQAVAGVIGGAAFALAAPFLVRYVFKVSPALSGEAVGVFVVVGLSVPVVLFMSGQRAVLEGAQRFDLSATIKMLGSIASLVIPAIGAVRGASLTSILLVVLLSRILVCVLYALMIRRALPNLRWVRSRDWALLRRVLSFGGWVLVSNTISPLLVYFDRFALGTIAGLAAVGFYTAPYEGVIRLLLIPVSLFSSLLPALTALDAGRQRERFAQLASSSERVLVPVMAIPLTVILVFAPELLRLWLGREYAVQSATALRLLAVGVFANSLANPLFVALYARKRPDLPAKFHLIELAVHIPLTIVLIRSFGIAGAAAAWMTRSVLDLCLLFGGAAATSQSSFREVAGGRVGRSVVSIVLFGLSLFASKALVGVSIALSLVTVVGLMAIFALASWRWILEDAERSAVTRTLRSYSKSLPRTPVPG